ncbi:YqeG family HAD IIIA-type phosphatase [Leptolyngbya sp. FACHB-321]|uniref:YqeG family HAD IIIA-type phosphatase n=1 Tax=Leptolyngbya sp. FACHB-321 TaxID=2692807 RepID=UPI001689FBBC|nr:YqeG family HAD IIIA-type phosphatase [Leptolyngbya sp. FACHB-321]MBD2033700.1 YqeG family HAD IIIA-type phosphatase [Leptolyngbya sp. FACHB-321]
MSWGKLLQPDLILHGPILKLTPAMLQQHQLKGLVLDVDETLVPIRMSEVSAELLPWVNEIRQVATLWLVSNNISENRIQRIAKTLDLPYITGAAKPSRRKLRRAVEAMGLPIEQVAMVGDRLFTDVLAGNRLGLFTILVEAMVNPNEAAKRSPLHALEVRLSQALGASFLPDMPDK